MKMLCVFLLLGVCPFLPAQTRTFRLPDLERKETQVFPVGAGAMPQDPLLMALGNPLTREQAVLEYKRLGAQAVPDLVAHLRDSNSGIRLLAISAMQYAWVPGTEQAVLPFLKSPRDAEAKSAWYLLKQKMEKGALDQWVREHLYEMNLGRLIEVMGEWESEAPDASRMLELLSRPRYWQAALPYLPRYTAPEFRSFTRYIADQAHGQWLIFALAGMIQQGDRSPLVWQQMEVFLANEDPRVREMSAEFYRWHGGKSALPLLKKAWAKEQDLFARESMAEALRIISIRTDADFPVPRQPMEPVVKYTGGLRPEDPEVSQKRIVALRKAMGYADQGARTVDGDAPGILVRPVRAFFNDHHDFGLQAKAGSGPFAGLVHLGRDMAWGEDMASVLAVAPGVVKRVQIARESWGGLVVIEHLSPSGKKFCSLYGHLGPLITVNPGDEVLAGAKLGGLGRSFTAENGGYLSHLHFSIYDGPYGSGKWVNGYMAPELFALGGHKWIDPYILYQGFKR
ncbi:peptidoglycan DD-metalloendopeptidase family protein [Kiritimatiellaeota bacterium B1221]|nr:peptidoglycan DD-metalloendopeptidase family protein [Kiritimatiellaeota bacterium B1221]